VSLHTGLSDRTKVTFEERVASIFSKRQFIGDGQIVYVSCPMIEPRIPNHGTYCKDSHFLANAQHLTYINYVFVALTKKQHLTHIASLQNYDA